jgi:hypothetical protein
MAAAHSEAFVFPGATGDLAYKQIFPHSTASPPRLLVTFSFHSCCNVLMFSKSRAEPEVNNLCHDPGSALPESSRHTVREPSPIIDILQNPLQAASLH